MPAATYWPASAQRRGVSRSLPPPSAKPPRTIWRAIPPGRVRYLSDIAETVRGYHAETAAQAEAVRRVQRLDEVRAVAKATDTPLVDLNADSAALVQRMGPVEAMRLAMTTPLPAERAAAKTGTTLPPRPKDEARLPDVPTTPDGPQGQIMRKFDYTHLGDTGARTVARIVADDLAKAVPALRSQLVP